MEDDRCFLAALTHVLGLEGGVTNFVWDPGGETAYGISRRNWPQYWANGTPTVATAKAFYRREFWNKMCLDRLGSQALRIEMFEAGVNCGHSNSVRFAQSAYELLRRRRWGPLKVDGIIGSKTILALNEMAAVYEDALLAGCNFYQAQYYVGLGSQLKGHALRGWFAKRLSWPA